MKCCYGLLKTLGIVLSFAIGFAAEAQTFEAELGELHGTDVATDLAGYSGSGYVTGFDNDGDAVTITFQAKKGVYDIYIRYAAPSGDKYNFIYVNDENLGSAAFPKTEKFVEVHAGKAFLDDGENTLAIVKEWGYFHVDNIRIATTDRSPVGPVAGQLVTPDPSKEADSLYAVLRRTYGKVILSGQYGGATEFDYIESVSGRTPVVRGFDFMDYSPSRVEHGTSSDETNQAIAWAARRGIVTFSWHWNAPRDLIDQPGKEWWRGFYTEATTFDLTKAMTEGSEEYALILRDIDAIAVQLKELAAADVPVLWRPLHEAEGKWFWWGAAGPEPCKWLWRLLYDRLVTVHGLDNLIWVWTSSGNSEAGDWYPGDEYVDIIGADIYLPGGGYGSSFMTFDKIAGLYQGKKIIALSENGGIPDPEKLFVQGAGWSWFCTWSGGFITDEEINDKAHIRYVYNHDYVITLDEVDDLTAIMAMLEERADGGEGKSNIFLEDFAVREAEIPKEFTEVAKPVGSTTAVVRVAYDDVARPVSRYVFGNNANVYMTQMVDQPVLLDHIRHLSPNVLRFPGGNLSSVYFWNAAPGVPPSDAPDKLVDANGAAIDPGYWYGENTQGWTLSVDNYYAMLEATDSEGILTVNYGYARYSTADDPVAAAAHLAAEWVRYDNGRTKFWEIGNESNGAWQAGYRIDEESNRDDQPEIITGELYGRHFRVFADSMRKAAADIGHTIYLGAQLLAEPPATWWNDTDRYWNDGVLAHAGEEPDFYIIHSYYTPYQQNSSAEEILASGPRVTRDMIEYVQAEMVDAGVGVKPVALTEWNIFAEGSKQMVSFISGMHAAIVLGELISEGYGLACRWDLANGWNDGNDHGMFSQGDQPGVPKWHPRPAFYYMYYFQRYCGDHMIDAHVVGSDDVLAYATTFHSGEVALVLVNSGTETETVAVTMDGFGYGERYYYHTLTGGPDNGEFSLKVLVNDTGPVLPAGGPPDFQSIPARSARVDGGIRMEMPPRSTQFVLVEHGDRLITRTEEEAPPVQVFPNPGQSYFRVILGRQGYSSLAIYNSWGVRVFTQPVPEGVGELTVAPGLAPGIYSLVLHGNFSPYQKRIVVR